MQVRLSSGKYDIIASGEAFLFGYYEDLDLRIEDADLSLGIVLRFEDDLSVEHDIHTEIADDSLIITCVNFNSAGMGLKQPAFIADVNGKKVYLMFASSCYGDKDNRSRSVKYTVFKEK